MDTTGLDAGQEVKAEIRNLQDDGDGLHGEPHSGEMALAYTCGSCRTVYRSIGDLHAHIHKHGLGGSYYYEHRYRTAFPKYDSICSETQTDSNKIAGNSKKRKISPKTRKPKRSHRLSRKEKIISTGETRITLPKEDDEDPILHQSNSEIASEPEINNDSEMAKETEEANDSEMAHEPEIDHNNEADIGNESETTEESDEPKKIKKAVKRRQAMKRRCKTRSTPGFQEEIKLEDTLKHTCHKCKLVFCSEEFLSTHEKKHAGVMLCDCCGEVFTSLDWLESHVLNGTGKSVNAVEMYVCSVCDISITELSGLKAHLCALRTRSSAISKDTRSSTISKDNPAPKKQAVRMYTSNATEKHGRCKLIPITEVSGNKPEQKVQCETCCLWFENDYFRVMHSVVHKYTSKCTKCNMYFTNDADRDLHTENCVHSAWRHVCTICGRRCQCKATLIAHEETHKSVKDLICEMCGKAFKTHNSVRIHVKERCPMLASRVRKFSCNLCDNKLFEKYQMRLHLQTVHSDIRPFVCEICARAFKTKDMLKHHFKIHKDRPTLPCEICGATFKDPGALRRHRKLHLDHKKWSCEYCGKQFNEKWNMKAHTRTHTGDKPYKCDWCATGFTHNVSRKAHMEKCSGARVDGSTSNHPRSNKSQGHVKSAAIVGGVVREQSVRGDVTTANRLLPNNISGSKAQSHIGNTDLVTQGHGHAQAQVHGQGQDLGQSQGQGHVQVHDLGQAQGQGHVQGQEHGMSHGQGHGQGHDHGQSQSQGLLQSQDFSHNNVNNKGPMDMCGQDFNHPAGIKAQRMTGCEENRAEINPIFLPGYPSYNFPRVPGYPF